jgi:hypothetical protein
LKNHHFNHTKKNTLENYSHSFIAPFNRQQYCFADGIWDGVIIEKVYCVKMVVYGKRQILAIFVIYGN